MALTGSRTMKRRVKRSGMERSKKKLELVIFHKSFVCNGIFLSEFLFMIKTKDRVRWKYWRQSSWNAVCDFHAALTWTPRFTIANCCLLLLIIIQNIDDVYILATEIEHICMQSDRRTSHRALIPFLRHSFDFDEGQTKLLYVVAFFSFALSLFCSSFVFARLLLAISTMFTCRWNSPLCSPSVYH